MSTDKRTYKSLENTKPFRLLMMIAVAIVLLAGCATPADEPAMGGTDQTTEDPTVALPIERFSTSQDIEMDHYVGAVDDQLFIGVAVAEPDASEAGPRTVAVYLCDSRDVSQWIRGEIAGQEATLDADGTRVDVTLADDTVSGTIALGDGEPQPFSAEAATDNAGLYRVRYSLGGVDHNIDWIVLPDGRQRGPLDGKGNDIFIFATPSPN